MGSSFSRLKSCISNFGHSFSSGRLADSILALVEGRRKFILGLCAVALILQSVAYVKHFGLVTFAQPRNFTYRFEDLAGRVANFRQLARTGDIYSQFSNQAFTYPPTAIPIYWLLVVPWHSGVTLVWTLVSSTSLVVMCAVLINQNFPQLKGAVTAAYACLTAILANLIYPPAYENIEFGQSTTFILMLFCIAPFARRSYTKGILIGVATAMKIFPGAYILLWCFRRQFKPVIVSCITLITLSTTIFYLWPKSTISFWRTEAIGGREVEHLSHGLKEIGNSSLLSPVLREVNLSQPADSRILTLTCLCSFVFGVYIVFRKNLESSPDLEVIVLWIFSAWSSIVMWDHYFAACILAPIAYLRLRYQSEVRVALALLTLWTTIPWWAIREYGGTSLWVIPIQYLAQNALWMIPPALLIAFFLMQTKGELRKLDNNQTIARTTL